MLDKEFFFNPTIKTSRSCINKVKPCSRELSVSWITPGNCASYWKDQPGRPSEKLGGRTAPTCSRGYPGPQTMPKYRINKTTHQPPATIKKIPCQSTPPSSTPPSSAPPLLWVKSDSSSPNSPTRSSTPAHAALPRCLVLLPTPAHAMLARGGWHSCQNSYTTQLLPPVPTQVLQRLLQACSWVCAWLAWPTPCF